LRKKGGAAALFLCRVIGNSASGLREDEEKRGVAAFFLRLLLIQPRKSA
jgi:hypothetical protein